MVTYTTETGEELAIVEFRNSNDVLVVSNIHVFERDVKGCPTDIRQAKCLKLH